MPKQKRQPSGESADAPEKPRTVRRTFAGPAGSQSPLRVSFSRSSYGELTAHAKSSLDAEVCGVLVGEICEDDDGKFVDVRAVIRGNAAREARAHVTFTHDTWNQIHSTLDRDYPDFQIVGWYHTHPGFGVEFSAMDRFIQQNFFSAKTQVAFLTDPLGGDVSLCFNGEEGLEYLTRFWVDGREHSAKVPGGAKESEAAPAGGGAGDVRRDIERLESRINQLIAAMDEQRTNFQRTLLTMLVVVCLGVVTYVAYIIWSDRFDKLQPPKLQSTWTTPMKVGDEEVMVTLGVLKWDVPPRLDAILDKYAKAEAELRAEEQRELQKRMQQQPPPKKK